MKKALLVVLVIIILLLCLCSCDNSVRQASSQTVNKSNNQINISNEEEQNLDKQRINGKNIIDTISNQEVRSGLLLGIAYYFDEKNDQDEDPQPTEFKYKTIWISPKGDDFNYLQKDGVIVAPGSDGFYEYKDVQVSKKKDYVATIDGSCPEFYNIEVNKMTSFKPRQKLVMPEIDLKDYASLIYYNETNNLLFVGNKYSIIYTDRVYTTGAGGYQYCPSITLHKHGFGSDSNVDKEISLKGLFDSNSIVNIQSQINQYKKIYDKTVSNESENDKEYIYEDNLALERREGKWRLRVPIMFSNWKSSHNYIKDFKDIDCILPTSLVSHDSLCINWDKIKKIEPDLIDAVSSPDKKILVVQTSKALKVYIVRDNDISKPKIEINLGANDKIILNQWATGKYVMKWNEELSKILK